jgi:hypothetical protein
LVSQIEESKWQDRNTDGTCYGYKDMDTALKHKMDDMDQQDGREQDADKDGDHRQRI